MPKLLAPPFLTVPAVRHGAEPVTASGQACSLTPERRHLDLVLPQTGARLHVSQGGAPFFACVKYIDPLGSEGKVDSTVGTEPQPADTSARADAPLLQRM